MQTRADGDLGDSRAAVRRISSPISPRRGSETRSPRRLCRGADQRGLDGGADPRSLRRGAGLGLTEASVFMEEINRSGGNSGACHGKMHNMTVAHPAWLQGTRGLHLGQRNGGCSRHTHPKRTIVESPAAPFASRRRRRFSLAHHDSMGPSRPSASINRSRSR